MQPVWYSKIKSSGKGESIALVENGYLCVSEGANMPSTPEAVEVFLNNKVLRIWHSGKLCEWGEHCRI